MLLPTTAGQAAQARDEPPLETTSWTAALSPQSDRLRSSLFTSGDIEHADVTADLPYANRLMAWKVDSDALLAEEPPTLPFDETSNASPDENFDLLTDESTNIAPEDFSAEVSPASPFFDTYHPADSWFWKMMPSGIIYHTYMASVHEPRMAFVPFYEFEKGRTLWDATLGGRAGVVRFGNCDPYRPQGWQLDIEGAVLVRLDVANRQDLDGSDFRFGFPITYAIDNWQIKFGYYHISSHLGDERILREPGPDERINYVRDGFLYGVSYYPRPSCRLYGEVGGAFNYDGGAKPIELQFGTELAQPGPTPNGAVPFFAINGHLRQDHQFGGDVSLQTGWLWRGDFGQTMRLGAHYFNGKSSQFQFYDTFEQQLGVGVWYDF
jgi:Protein of unknown function (DUF1207)